MSLGCNEGKSFLNGKYNYNIVYTCTWLKLTYNKWHLLFKVFTPISKKWWQIVLTHFLVWSGCRQPPISQKCVFESCMV